ncbi:MAG: hypothetical protein WA183_12055 [Chthoniobacterales bacterium]
MTAAEIYNSVTNGGASDFAEVAAILDRHGPWCLIGGLAVNCYVEPVYTMDADMIVVAENLAAIRDELVAGGFSICEFPRSINAKKMKSKLNLQFTTDLRYQNFVRAVGTARRPGNKRAGGGFERCDPGENLGLERSREKIEQAQEG